MVTEQVSTLKPNEETKQLEPTIVGICLNLNEESKQRVKVSTNSKFPKDEATQTEVSTNRKIQEPSNLNLKEHNQNQMVSPGTKLKTFINNKLNHNPITKQLKPKPIIIH